MIRFSIVEEEEDEEEKADEKVFCFLGMHFPESDLDSAMVLPKDFFPLDPLDVLRRREAGLIPSAPDDVDVNDDASKPGCSFLVPVLPHDDDDSSDSGPCCSFLLISLTPLSRPLVDSKDTLFFTFWSCSAAGFSAYSGTRLLRDVDCRHEELDFETDSV